jgi:LuxR family maltose regulon positive regulatory protein
VVASTMFFALVWRHPQHPELDHWRKRSLRFASHIADASRRIEQMCFIIEADMMLGNHAEAACLIEQVRNEMKSQELSPPARILYRLVLTFNAWRAGFTRAAVEHAFAGLELADRSGVHIWDFRVRIHGATGALSDGDLQTSAKLLEATDFQSPVSPSVKGSHHEYIAAWHTALKRETARALEHARRAVELGEQAGTPFFEGLAHFGLSNVLHNAEDLGAASREVDVAVAIARRIRSQILEFACLMHKAWFAFEEERHADGLNYLREALTIGASQDYYNFSWSRPQVLAQLCETALEYGMKVQYVQDLIRRRSLVPETPPLHVGNWPWPVKLTTFGRFEISVNNHPVTFSRKAPKKPISLLKAVIALGGRDVPEARLMDALWPDEDADAALAAFTVALYRLRKLLGEDVIQLQNGRVTLDPHRCWIDVWAFERLLDQAQSAARDGDPTTHLNLSEKALNLYQGAFLAADADEPWALAMRERLQTKFIRHVSALGKRMIEVQAWEQAAAYYARGLDVDNLAEELYQGLMRCHLHCGRFAEGLAVYRRLRQTLSVILGIKPSAASDALYEALRRGDPDAAEASNSHLRANARGS